MTSFFQFVVYYSKLIVPWLLIGIVLSYFLEKYLQPSIYRKFSGKPKISKIILAQLLGMISPLSIMSFLPIARQLTDKGVHPALLLSFFIAERAYDSQSFFIISGLFGLQFAFLNALAIFLSLVFTAMNTTTDQITFQKKKEKQDGFWQRQSKLFAIVILGILLGAVIKTAVPQTVVQNFAGKPIEGFFSALFLGFSLYMGPIIGNYPIAKALADLGMSHLGVFTFLTVSPIFNIVVIFLFGAAVGMKKVSKAILLYTVSSLVLSALFGVLV